MSNNQVLHFSQIYRIVILIFWLVMDLRFIEDGFAIQLFIPYKLMILMTIIILTFQVFFEIFVSVHYSEMNMKSIILPISLILGLILINALFKASFFQGQRYIVDLIALIIVLPIQIYYFKFETNRINIYRKKEFNREKPFRSERKIEKYGYLILIGILILFGWPM